MSVCLLFWVGLFSVLRMWQSQRLKVEQKGKRKLVTYCTGVSYKNQAQFSSHSIEKYRMKQKHQAPVMAILQTQWHNENEKCFKVKSFFFSLSLCECSQSNCELVPREMFVFRMWNKLAWEWSETKKKNFHQIVALNCKWSVSVQAAEKTVSRTFEEYIRNGIKNATGKNGKWNGLEGQKCG